MKPRVTIFGDLTLDGREGLSLTLDPPLRASIDGDQDHIQDVADAVVRDLESAKSDGTWKSKTQVRRDVRDTEGITFRSEELIDALERLEQEVTVKLVAIRNAHGGGLKTIPNPGG